MKQLRAMERSAYRQLRESQGCIPTPHVLKEAFALLEDSLLENEVIPDAQMKKDFHKFIDALIEMSSTGYRRVELRIAKPRQLGLEAGVEPHVIATFVTAFYH